MRISLTSPTKIGPAALRQLITALLLLVAIAGPALAKGGIIFIPIITPGSVGLPPEKTADYGVGHTVAIISVMGSRFTLHNDHFMGGTSRQIDIADWGLDADITASLKHYLTGRFNFKDVPYDRAIFAALPNGPWDNSAPFANAAKSVPADGLDFFLVIRPALQGPGFQGMALENMGDDDAPVVWANYEIDLVDVHNGDPVAIGYSRAKLRDGHVTFSGMAAPDALHVGDNAQPTAEQVPLLHRTANSLVSVSLVETLRVLNMGDNLPPIGARTMLPVPSDRNPYKDYKRVAVVSGLGDTLSMHHIGGTILSQSDYQTSEPDWHLDAAAEERAKAALAKTFQIAEPDVDRATFANAMIWNDDGKLAANFPGLKPDPGIDLYVVFVKRNAHTYALNMAKIKGFGVFDRRPITAEPNVTGALVHFGVAIIDAHTMKMIAASPGVIPSAKAYLMPPLGIPYQFLISAWVDPEPFEEVGTDNWPANPPAMSADQASAIHAKMLEVLNGSVDETLLRLGILGVVPVEGAPLGAPAPAGYGQ